MLRIVPAEQVSREIERRLNELGEPVNDVSEQQT